jgi:hypothetical protein
LLRQIYPRGLFLTALLLAQTTQLFLSFSTFLSEPPLAFLLFSPYPLLLRLARFAGLLPASAPQAVETK